jgi:hypothetical protein
MAGGLIQISTYGSQDLFLTGTPEITFFKIVYRRHTHFAVESLYLNFDDPVYFGSTSSITIPHIGDLIHHTYLEIDIPEINLIKYNAPTNISRAELKKAQENYDITINFMTINRQAYVESLSIIESSNNTDSSKIISIINSIFNNPVNQTTILNFKILMSDPNYNPVYTYDEVSMQSVVSTISPSDPKEFAFTAMNISLDKSTLVQQYFFNLMKDQQIIYQDLLNKHIKFAWVNKLGHAILNYMEIYIGGQKVDKSYGDWLNIWYELSSNRDIQDTYYRMIGNIPELTGFNKLVKPKYQLRIPLQFWYSRFSGLALPLVALEYHDVRFVFNFRNIEDVSYIEKNATIESDVGDSIFLDEVPEQLKLNISARLLVDFIYLDSGERRRFAQASHEYLIEQLQLIEYPDISLNNYEAILNSFVHPTKELVWVVQKTSYTDNITGYHKNVWDNYSINYETGVGNPVLFSTLTFNSYSRLNNLDRNYFNYVQPYQCHKTTPSDGINCYSFSIFPEEHQPSGTANLSMISKISLTLNIDPQVLVGDTVNIRIYAVNYNILRIVSGMAGLAYTFG